MEDKHPLVSIGMIVRNEERYLPQTLDSIITQDYQNIEIVISDNASEDNTQAICLEYATRDHRIHYYRNEKDIGAIANLNRAFQLSSGEYFMHASGHDLKAPTYISRCIEILEQFTSVVLCYSDVMLMDSDGLPLGLMPGRVDTRHLSSLSRAIKYLRKHIYGNLIYGVIRSSALKQTRLFRYTIGPDDVILLELSMLGEFAHIPEPLLFRRQNRDPETPGERLKRYRRIFGGSNRKQNQRLPFWSLVYESLLAVKQGPLPRLQKIVLAIYVLIHYSPLVGRYFIESVFKN